MLYFTTGHKANERHDPLFYPALITSDSVTRHTKKTRLNPPFIHRSGQSSSTAASVAILALGRIAIVTAVAVVIALVDVINMAVVTKLLNDVISSILALGTPHASMVLQARTTVVVALGLGAISEQASAVKAIIHNGGSVPGRLLGLRSGSDEEGEDEDDSLE